MSVWFVFENLFLDSAEFVGKHEWIGWIGVKFDERTYHDCEKFIGLNINNWMQKLLDFVVDAFTS